MTTRHILLALALSMPALAGTQDAPVAAPVATPVAPSHSLAPLQQDPQLVTGELPNGIRYIIRPTAEPEGRGSVRLYVDNGSLNESKATSGLSHLIEHLVFNGSRTYKRGELIPVMQKLGLGFGGDVNAYTGLLQTVYKLDLPQLDEETVHTALTIMRDFADGATLTDEAINHERGIVISELKARDSQSYRTLIATLGFLCNGTRVPEFMPIGLEEVIRDIPCEQVRQFYRDNYLSRRMTVVVTGDFKPEDMLEQVKKHFSGMADAGTPPARPEIGTPANVGADEMIIRHAEQAHVNISLSIVNPWHFKADTIEQRIADMPLTVACAMLNQRLARMARQEDCPFMSANVGESNLFESTQLFAASFSAQPQNWEKALAAVEQELRRACEFGFSEQELSEIARSSLSTALVNEKRWATTTCNAMADALIDAIGEKAAFTAPEEDTRSLRMALERIAADPDICRRALKEAYDAARTRLSLTGNVPEGVTDEKLRAAYNAAHAVQVTPPAEEKMEAFAYDNPGTPGKVLEAARLEDIDVTTLTLSNGIRVNIKPISTRKDAISVTARIDGGSRAMVHTPGLNILTESVMSQGGLEAHSNDDLVRILAGRHVGINFSSEMDRYVFSGGCTPEDFELQCQLLVAGILHPGFRETGEVMLSRSLPQIYNRLRTTPEGAFSYQSARILHGDDPRFTMPTQEQLESLTTEQVKEAITPALQQGAMEVTVVGDFRTEDIIPVLERTFGAMPERNREFSPVTEEQRRVHFNDWGRNEFLRYSTELDKTIVTHVRHVGNGRDTRRNRRLQVLNSIVREKLFDGIRAELGETYSPIVRTKFNSAYDNAATISTASAGVKGNRIKVNTAMELILRNLALEGGISDDDFERAIRPIISATEKSLQTPEYWQGAIARIQTEPEKLAELRDLMQDLQSMTADEIRSLAREIFGNDEKLNRFFTVPEDFDSSKQ